MLVVRPTWNSGSHFLAHRPKHRIPDLAGAIRLGGQLWFRWSYRWEELRRTLRWKKSNLLRRHNSLIFNDRWVRRVGFSHQSLCSEKKQREYRWSSKRSRDKTPDAHAVSSSSKDWNLNAELASAAKSRGSVLGVLTSIAIPDIIDLQDTISWTIVSPIIPLRNKTTSFATTINKILY